MQKESSNSSKAKQEKSDTPLVDPVCGMDLSGSTDEIEQAEHKGTTYYFCSAECRKQFEASPQEYV